jgi:hypothetical protein
LAGGKLLVKDQFAFQNAFSQPYAIQSLDYYLSNFKLRNPSQQEFFAEVGSYHLVNALLNSGETIFTINNVPGKKFSELEFSIGVDSVANSRTDQVGDLDPANGGMAWDWTTGYKFFALTGRWQKGTETRPLVFHIGENFNYKTLVFKFSDVANSDFEIRKDAEIQLEFDLNEAFQSPDSVNFENTFDVHSKASGSGKIANNYAQGLFRLAGVR